MEPTYDNMYTVSSRLRVTVTKEDDGVAVRCIVEHPAVKDFQAQRILEVECKTHTLTQIHSRMFEKFTFTHTNMYSHTHIHI